MKRILSVILLAVLMLSLASCGGASVMTMGTGSPTGTYYAYGGVLGQYITNNAGITANAVSTGGSKDNIQGIVTDAIGVALVAAVLVVQLVAKKQTAALKV